MSVAFITEPFTHTNLVISHYEIRQINNKTHYSFNMYMAIWVRVFNGTFTIVVMWDQFYAP